MGAIIVSPSSVVLLMTIRRIDMAPLSASLRRSICPLLPQLTIGASREAIEQQNLRDYQEVVQAGCKSRKLECL